MGWCGWRFVGAVELVEGWKGVFGRTCLKVWLAGVGELEGEELAVGGGGWVEAFEARRLVETEYPGVG